jgi:hypothetical protein
MSAGMPTSAAIKALLRSARNLSVSQAVDMEGSQIAEWRDWLRNPALAN